MKLLLFVNIVLIVESFATEHEWRHFKHSFNKNYDATEESHRLNIFLNNLQKIQIHNAKYENGEVGYYLGINQFADLTAEEFVSKFTSQVSAPTPITHKVPEIADDVPAEMDWRTKGAVLDVKNQLEGCKSSWAFTATGVIEGQLAIQKKQYIPLSEQHLIDCSTPTHYNRGCRDGNSDYAFLFVHDHGICAESDYPYTGQVDSCKNCSLVLETIAYPMRVQVNETNLKEIVGTIGPVAVALSVNENWHLYKGGIFDDPTCTGYGINYWALTIGYSSENGIDYWIVKNSLGKSWGEDGYIRLIRGKKMCNIYQQPWYALL